MSKFCDHFQSLKVEKIANFIKKANFKCSVSKHQDSQFNLCLHCGETKCNNNQFNCSKLHSENNKHPLALKLLSSQIICHFCNIVIEQMLNQDAGGHNKKKIQKVCQLHDKIIDLSQKYAESFLSYKNSYDKQSKKSQIKIQKQKLKQRDKQSQKKIELRTFGLANIGNTCYFNSILQCLYSSVQIHELYEKNEFKDDLNITFKKFLRNSQKVFCPKSLFSVISKQYKFLKGMGQQDAFQLFVLLIDSLIQRSTTQKIEHKIKIQNSIGRLFGFYCANRLQCLNCAKISWNKDFNLGLTVPLVKGSHKNIQIPEDEQISIDQIGQKGLYYPSNKGSNNFLDNFFCPQLLSKSSSYKCEKCKQSDATLKSFIKQPPQLLAINFKRFNNSGVKVNTHVNIPSQIQLTNFCLKKGVYKYEIFAGAVHSGTSRGGHYIAYTKRNNYWFYFSDSHVKQSSLSTLKQSNPYVIFYRKIFSQINQQQIDYSTSKCQMVNSIDKAKNQVKQQQYHVKSHSFQKQQEQEQE